MKVATHLYFGYDAREAIEAYRDIFGAQVVCEYPHDENTTRNHELPGRVFHAELRIGDLPP
jgi:uncharacterized glyoxalase superfamily protein PhnB